MYESRSAGKPVETTNGFFSVQRSFTSVPPKADISQKYVCGIFLRFRDSVVTMRKSDGGMSEKRFAQAIIRCSFPVHPLSVISFYPLNYPLDRDCTEVDGRIHARIVLSWFYINRKSINFKIDVSNWLSQQEINLQLM